MVFLHPVFPSGMSRKILAFLIAFWFEEHRVRQEKCTMFVVSCGYRCLLTWAVIFLVETVELASLH